MAQAEAPFRSTEVYAGIGRECILASLVGIEPTPPGLKDPRTTAVL